MGRFIDLTGQQFGHLTVLEQVADNVLPSGLHEKMWRCRCDCGRETVARGSFLRTGHTTSCGCRKTGTNFIDLTGKCFSGVTVLRRVGRNSPPQWLCCCSCGTEFITRGSSLANGHTKSCGCRKKQLRISDMIGRRFGSLTVALRGDDEIAKNGARHIRWICKCVCGRTALVRGTSLRNGHTMSCGCARVENMARGKGPSKYELMVSEWLAGVGLKYTAQRSFPSLVGTGGGLLSYDFDVRLKNGNRVLVECQGEQHYHPVEIFGGESYFRIQQSHDRMKREYAKKRHIPLIELDCRNNRSEDDIKKQFNDSLFGFQDIETQLIR